MSTMIPIKKKATGKGTKKLNPKQKLVKANAEQRLKAQSLALHWQEKLFSHKRVSARTLCEAAKVLQPQTYEEVVEERAVQDYCGYPLCHRAPKKHQSRLRISLSQRKVYDQTELASFCSDACHQRSTYYSLQLAEDPVWMRELSAAVRIHVVPMDEDVKQSIAQANERGMSGMTTQELRQEYVQQLLANVPADGRDFEIVENTQSDGPQSISLPTSGVHDAVEGYRIQAKNTSNAPSTMILNKEVQPAAPALPLNDEEALIEDAMETMMMLKDLKLDREHEKPAALRPILPTHPTPVPPRSPTTPISPVSLASPPLTNRAEPPNGKAKDANIIQVTTQSAKKPKKKIRAPQMSLFGETWTMIDRLTTRTTRQYLANLKSKQSVNLASDQSDEPADDAVLVRGHIFSEKILDTFGLMRSQIGLTRNLESDLLDLIKTLRFSDASIVVLSPAQTYMMTLVLFKAIADETLAGTDWLPGFERCCEAIGQSGDAVDACVRVLKVAST